VSNHFLESSDIKTKRVQFSEISLNCFN